MPCAMYSERSHKGVDTQSEPENHEDQESFLSRVLGELVDHQGYQTAETHDGDPECGTFQTRKRHFHLSDLLIANRAFELGLRQDTLLFDFISQMSFKNTSVWSWQRRWVSCTFARNWPSAGHRPGDTSGYTG